MHLSEIVAYWSRFGRDEATGRWIHPDDRAVLAGRHSFNLDHPTCPYVGRVTSAKVVILGANGGYSPTVTPAEFTDAEAVERYVRRIRDPENGDWSNVSPYYDGVNYGSLVHCGDAVWINASPYRSPRISAEPDNQRVVRSLPSSMFIRRWLIEAVVPLAARGERLVIVKRPGLWRLRDEVRAAKGVIVDPAPVSRHLTSGPWRAVQDFLAGHSPDGSAHVPGAHAAAGRTRAIAESGEVQTRHGLLATDDIEAGVPQSQVAPLVHVCAVLGLRPVDPEAAWPGYRKAVRLVGGRTIYINRTNADVRSGPAEVAAWQKAGLGTVRPDNDRYLRVELEHGSPRPR